MSPITFNSNPSARAVQRSLGAGTDALRRVSERLASGQRINRASDDAAGLAVSSSLLASSRIYGQGIRNANDAISALNIADGSLDQMSSMIARMKELAIQSSSGTVSSTQRRSLDREAQALASEFARIQSTTNFNGISLLGNSSGNTSIQLGSGNLGRLNINLGIYGTGTTTSTVQGGGFQDITGPTVYTGNGTVFAIGDVNADGVSDLILADDFSQTIRVVQSDSSSFNFTTTSTSYSGSAVSLVAGDFNHDNASDFVLGTSNGDLSIFQGSGGSGSFIQTGTLNVGSLSAAKSITTDLDSDGNVDVVFASGSNLITLINDGGGGFISTVSSFSATAAITSIAAGEFSGDGMTDIAVSAGGSVQLFRGAGNGDFAARTTLANSATRVASAGDIDGDGKDDLISVSGTALNVYMGTGASTFTLGYSHAVANPTDLIISDYNGDGKKDIQVMSNSAVLFSFAGDGTGGFSMYGVQISPDSLSSPFFGLAAGDLDGDGYTDAFTLGGGGIAAFRTIADPLSTTTETTTTIALDSFSLTSSSGARSALAILDSAMDKITATRGILGSDLSRLGSGLNTLQTTRENSLAAAGRIIDADMALESANYVRLKLLQDTGAALLAQANQIPNLALSLLRS